LATARGEVKKTALQGFSTTRAIGLVAMDLEEGDELVAARLAGPKDDVIIIPEAGQPIRFGVAALRPASRASGGVRGIRLAKGDRVVTMGLADPNVLIFVGAG